MRQVLKVGFTSKELDKCCGLEVQDGSGVRTLLIRPGWVIEQSNDCLRNIWVLEPKALVKFLANAPQKLEPDEVKLVSFHLSRFIRSESRA